MIQNYLNIFGKNTRTSHTKINLAAFQAYNQATGLIPTQAFIEADDEEEQGIRLNRRKIIKTIQI